MTGRRKEVFSNLNIVPYLDVMLVLLVIFMATTPIVQTGVTVDLAVGKASTLKSQEPMTTFLKKSLELIPNQICNLPYPILKQLKTF